MGVARHDLPGRDRGHPAVRQGRQLNWAQRLERSVSTGERSTELLRRGAERRRRAQPKMLTPCQGSPSFEIRSHIAQRCAELENLLMRTRGERCVCGAVSSSVEGK